MDPLPLVSLPTAVIDDLVYIERPYVDSIPRMRQLIPIHAYHKQKSKKIQKIKASLIYSNINATNPKRCQKIDPTLRKHQLICSIKLSCQTSKLGNTRAPDTSSPTFGGLSQQRQTANFGQEDFGIIAKNSCQIQDI